MATVNVNVTTELPPLLPPPRHIEVLEGTTTLSADVRLSTRDVLPFMRKGMRSIFTAAEIRVVANKKKFVIEVHIVEESEVDLSDVPAALRKDAYEMEIVDNLVTIRSASQSGAAWGVQTFADIYVSAGPECVIPNVKIRDWSSIPVRGFFLPCTPALEMMRYDEFTEVVDRMARAKCNLLGVELFRPYYAPEPELMVAADTLLIPLPGEKPPAAQQKTYTWFDPETDNVQTDEGFPPLIEAQGLNKFIAYTTGKGLDFMPGLAFPGKSRLLPAIYPELKGTSSTSREAQDICCLTTEKGRDAIESLLTHLLEEVFEETPQYFMINLDSVPPTDDPRHWCQCATCKDKAPLAICQDYVKWLVVTLTAKGISKVVLSSSDSTAQLNVVTDRFKQEMADNGLASDIILHTPGQTSDSQFEVYSKTCTALGAGADSTDGIKAILDITDATVENNGPGILADTRADAQSLIPESIMALHAWASPVTDSPEEACQYAARNIAPTAAEKLENAIKELLTATTAANSVATTLKTYAQNKDAKPASITDLVLRALEKDSDDDGAATLATAKETAGQAANMLDELIEQLTPSTEVNSDEESPAAPPSYLTAMRGECAFIQAISNYFITLLPHKTELRSQSPSKAVVQAMNQAAQDLKKHMAKIKKYKSRCAATANLCMLSTLL